jgi:hypothetical protein
LFANNPVGSAIVNAAGPIRQIVHDKDKTERRYLVIAQGLTDRPGPIAQVQLR